MDFLMCGCVDMRISRFFDVRIYGLKTEWP